MVFTIIFHTDASLLREKSAGISHDFNRIINNYPEHDFRLFYTSKFTSRYKASYKISQGAQSLLGPSPYEIKRQSQELIFIPQLRGHFSKDPQQTVIRIHDLFPFQYPEFFPKLSRKLFVDALKVIDKESMFLTNSRTTSRTLRDIIGVKDKNIFLQHCLPPQVQKNCDLCFGEFIPIESPYILAVGTIEPRKNYETLLTAFRIYRNKGGELNLVIIGKPGWLSKRIESEIDMAQNVIWLKQICDCKVQKLINGSSAFISVSIDEGFNLPAAEARFFGKQLILSDIAIHRELHGEIASFCDLEPINIAREIATIPMGYPVMNTQGTWIDSEIGNGLHEIVTKMY